MLFDGRLLRGFRSIFLLPLVWFCSFSAAFSQHTSLHQKNVGAGPALTATLSLTADLTGWWAVVEDNGRLIKMKQQDSDLTILDAYGALLANGRFANDTLLIFFSPTDTLVFVYAADTLRGHNELGDPITFVRFLVDLTGWWRQLESGKVSKMQQQGTTVTFWEGLDSTYVGDFTFVNDTLMGFAPPPMNDTVIVVYAADTLRLVKPEGEASTLVRAPQGPWAAIPYGAITVDGDTSDWPKEFLVADDPNGDGTGNPSAELDRLYLCFDCNYLYVRIDCVGDAAFPHSGDISDRYSIGLGHQLNGQYDYGIRFWNTSAINFRNNNTGQETTLEAPGVRGSTIEGRVPLSLLENIEQADISTESAYYDWDRGWVAYDEIEVYAKRRLVARGDMDTSGGLGLYDVVLMLNCVFLATGDCGLCFADVNCSTDLSPADVVLELLALFLGSPFPC